MKKSCQIELKPEIEAMIERLSLLVEQTGTVGLQIANRASSLADLVELLVEVTDRKSPEPRAKTRYQIRHKVQQIVIEDLDEKDAANTYRLTAARVQGLADSAAESRAVPKAAYRILHALLPMRDRDGIERQLEEQLQDDADNPAIGPRLARWYYRWRAATNVTSCLWDALLTQAKRATKILSPVVELMRKLGPS